MRIPAVPLEEGSRKLYSENGARQSTTVHTLRCFEAIRRCAGDKMTLAKLWASGRLHWFGQLYFQLGHAPTNYTRWGGAPMPRRRAAGLMPFEGEVADAF